MQMSGHLAPVYASVPCVCPVPCALNPVSCCLYPLRQHKKQKQCIISEGATKTQNNFEYASTANAKSLWQWQEWVSVASKGTWQVAPSSKLVSGWLVGPGLALWQHVVKANCSDKMCSQIKYNLRILKSGQITRRQQQQQLQEEQQHATTATFCRFLRSLANEI